jgi:PTS system fructose-specific IIC component
VETLKKYLKAKNIKIDLEGENREDIYRELLTLLKKNKEIDNKDSVLKNILNREEALDPYMGKGVIIVRLHLHSQENISLAFGVKKEGLDEEVFDRERIRIVLIIITQKPAKKDYGNLISGISQLLNQPSIMEDILEAEKESDIVKILTSQ